jgi:LPXTG-site transpeptidase (sortase) family protein
MTTNSSYIPDENHRSDSIDPDSALDTQAAANLVREKLKRIYGDEPNVTEELDRPGQVPRRSKHQQFMYDLSTSGKDLATIQTQWHDYYLSLPDTEKHQVWQEFYESQPLQSNAKIESAKTSAQILAEHKHKVISSTRAKLKTTKKLIDNRNSSRIKADIRKKVSAEGKLTMKHHLQSLLFGLSMGTIVIIIFMFSFFNEVIIAPFIQPSRADADTPLIIGTNAVAPTPNPEVIIPKINVEIPVDYSETSTNENAIENDLMSGVVHYPTTSLPGQVGNAAYFGHSSNNIFNKGKYKFAFVLLHTLVNGDTFYLTFNDKVFIYKVISHQVVSPSDVSVLNPVAGQVATATLITCDPPGTSINRLIVVGQQISPNPDSNSTSTAVSTIAPTSLPSDGPSLWSRFTQSSSGKVSIYALIIGVFILAIRWLWRPKASRSSSYL